MIKTNTRKFHDQKSLIKEARRKSAKIFSKEENHEDVFSPEDGRNYFYFPGISYFKKETITPDMINKLQAGGSLLSVGSGNGHLERLISKGFNISEKQIAVSDIELDQKLNSYNFRKYQFDMVKPWPDLEKKFDYILFPESLGVATHNFKHGPTYRFFDELNTDTKRILQGDKPEDPDLFITVIEMDEPRSLKIYEIMKEAISRLNAGGEIRVCYGINTEREVAYLTLKLQQEVERVTFNHPNVTIKIQD